jgi:hypothetical protein
MSSTTMRQARQNRVNVTLDSDPPLNPFTDKQLGSKWP